MVPRIVTNGVRKIWFVVKKLINIIVVNVTENSYTEWNLQRY